MSEVMNSNEVTGYEKLTCTEVAKIFLQKMLWLWKMTNIGVLKVYRHFSRQLPCKYGIKGVISLNSVEKNMAFEKIKF